MHVRVMAWKTDRIALRLRPEIRAALAEAALADSRTLSAYVEIALEQHLRRKGLIKGSLPSPSKPSRSMREVFTAHKARAKQRGIPFLFDFVGWSEWWSEDGRWERREREHLCMGRKGDVGPYSSENVYCTTESQNARDYWQAQRAEKEKRK